MARPGRNCWQTMQTHPPSSSTPTSAGRRPNYRAGAVRWTISDLRGRRLLPALFELAKKRAPEGARAMGKRTYRRRLHVIRLLAMHGRVQTFALLVFRHAQTDDKVGDFVGNRGHYTRPDQGRAHAPGLRDELRGNRVIRRNRV